MKKKHIWNVQTSHVPMFGRKHCIDHHYGHLILLLLTWIFRKLQVSRSQSGEAVAGLEGPLELCLSLEQLPVTVFHAKRRSSTAGKLTLPPNQICHFPWTAWAHGSCFSSTWWSNLSTTHKKVYRLGQPLLPGKETWLIGFKKKVKLLVVDSWQSQLAGIN